MQFLLCLVFTSFVLTVFAKDLCYSGACDPDQTCCETVFDQLIFCCQMPDAVCCDGQILCCPKGFVCGPQIGSCQRKPTREYLDDINALRRHILPDEERYLDNINELEKRQGLPAELRYLDNVNELEKLQGLPAELRYLDDISELEKRQGLPDEERNWNDINELKKRQGLPDEMNLNDINELEKRQDLPVEERPFFQTRCDAKTFCPHDRTCCINHAGTYGCCPHLYATCCPDKIHCCPHNQKCDATSRYCLGKDSIFQSKAQGPAIVIEEP